MSTRPIGDAVIALRAALREQGIDNFSLLFNSLEDQHKALRGLADEIKYELYADTAVQLLPQFAGVKLLVKSA